jgi:hypothetical protein
VSDLVSNTRGWYLEYKPDQEIVWRTVADIYERPCSIMK